MLESGGPALCTIHAAEDEPGLASHDAGSRRVRRTRAVAPQPRHRRGRSCRACRRRRSARRPPRPRRAGTSRRPAPQRAGGEQRQHQRSIAPRGRSPSPRAAAARSVEPWIRPRLPISAPQVELGLGAGADPDHDDPPAVVERLEVRRRGSARRRARGSRRTGRARRSPRARSPRRRARRPARARPRCARSRSPARRPRAPSWIAAVPTPPAAPWTSSRSPGRSPAWVKSASCAVVNTSGTPPAAAQSRLLGHRHQRSRSCTTASSACPPPPTIAHHPVAHREALGARARADHLAGQLEARDVRRRAGRRRVEAAALHHVGAVEAGRPDARQHLAGAGGRVGMLLDAELLIAIVTARIGRNPTPRPRGHGDDALDERRARRRCAPRGGAPLGAAAARDRRHAKPRDDRRRHPARARRTGAPPATPGPRSARSSTSAVRRHFSGSAAAGAAGRRGCGRGAGAGRGRTRRASAPGLPG